MKFRRLLVAGSVFSLLVLVFGSQMRGDTKVFSTSSSEPMMVGNVVLPPGTHEWRLVDSDSNRHIVQITDGKTHRVEATILAIPDYRETVSDDHQLQFWETPVGSAQAVRTWFRPGEYLGQEFAFPKHLVMKPPVISPMAIAQVNLPAPAPAQQMAEGVGAVHPAARLHGPEKAGEGSWAVISNGLAVGPQQAAVPVKQKRRGVWDTLRSLPLTATVAPLIGLVGVVLLGFYLMSYGRRRKRVQAA